MGHRLGDGGGGPLVHHVALLLLRCVVQAGEGGHLLGGVGAVPQAPGGDGGQAVLAAAEKLEVDTVGLEVVSVVRGDTVEGLWLQRRSLSEGVGEGAHPANTLGYVCPFIS